MEINVLFIDLITEGVITGIDQHTNIMSNFLQATPFTINRLSIISHTSSLGISVKRAENGLHLQVPITKPYFSQLEHATTMAKYAKVVCTLTARYLPYTLDIIHLQAYQLFPLASALKKRQPRCRIISHIHFIPWKGHINKSTHKFNLLQSLYNYESTYLRLTTPIEQSCYNESDAIICLTEHSKLFIEKVSPKAIRNISTIPNGMSDFFKDNTRGYNHQDTFHLIFVGSLTKGKGLDFILEAMRIAQARGAKLTIDVAGTCSDRMRKDIHSRYPELAISLHGRVERDDLMELYRSADIGVIASLQEQCSYTAIEMAMMALPIITTAVDGLDEMFEDEVNALKVPVHFSRIRGLSVDVAQYAECLVRLTKDESLRARLGQSARHLYLSRYTLEEMGEATISLYRQLQESV